MKTKMTNYMKQFRIYAIATLLFLTNNSIFAQEDLPLQIVCDEYSTSVQGEDLGTGEWTAYESSQIVNYTLFNTQINNLEKGENFFLWTSSEGKAYNLIISVHSVLANAGADHETCTDETYLTGDRPQPGGYGVWSQEEVTAVIVSPSVLDSKITDLNIGLNTFIWTVYEKGCDNGGSSVTVTNKQFFVNAGADQLLEPVGTIVINNTSLDADDLSGMTGATGQWVLSGGGGNISFPNEPDSPVEDLGGGVNTFTWTVKYNGCEASDDVDITVKNFIPNAGLDNNTCVDYVRMGAANTPGATHEWEVIEGSGTFDDKTNPISMVYGLQRGANTFRWQVTYSGYTTYDDVTICNNQFQANAHTGNETEHCKNIHTMDAELPGTDAVGTWTHASIYTGGIFADNTLSNTQVTGMNTGINKYRWYVEWRGCYSSDTVTVIWSIPPIVEFELSINTPTVFISDNPMFFVNKSDRNYAEYLWDFGDGISKLNTDFVDIESHVYNTWGEYEVNLTVSISDKCSAVWKETVILLEPGDSVDELESDKINIYPNPNKGVFFLKNESGIEENQIEIINSIGKSVKFNISENTSNSFKIDLSENSKGVYFIKIKNKDSVITKKIILE